MPSRFSLFNDPVHGFVSVPKGLLLALVDSPEVQRLRRIRQLGLGFLVFPGAVHTRFEHGLGAMALLQSALDALREKGTVVATDEVEGALAAALLHDVGHGPFSHTLEADLLPYRPDASGAARPFRHEAMSRALMVRLDARTGGALGVALEMFDGTYARPFFHSLLASQLDMDRLDYLRRDSFYTGVAEGVVGVERVLKTMRVHPPGPMGRLVIEAKGAYAVENVLLSRRLMYAQVYLHKTVVAADHVLRAAFLRARALWGHEPALAHTSPALAFFLAGRTTADALDAPGTPEHEALLDAFTALDDTDVLYSLKRWAEADDRVLADLAQRFTDRRLFRTVVLPDAPTSDDVAAWHDATAAWLVASGLSTPATSRADAMLYVSTGVQRLAAYRATEDPICILERDGRVHELTEADTPAALSLAQRPDKAYVCLPKEVAHVVGA
ncbi:MAG TPA: HD domain-containing protein [Rubricoccaceae bacterium]